jgi:hypothetical protein
MKKIKNDQPTKPGVLRPKKGRSEKANEGSRGGRGSVIFHSSVK